MSSPKPGVSFIGLGAMGFGMATNLVKLGYPVTGFDLYPPSLEKFKQASGLVASTVAEAVNGKTYCVCMVATAQQAQSVLFEGQNPAIKAFPKDAVLLLCSTVPYSYVQQLERTLADRDRADIFLVDCPVSGGAIRAANGTLSIMAGASDEALSRGKELLQAMSDPAKLYLVKGGIGAGSKMKMAHQVLAANQILSASEAMGLASRFGLDLKEASTQSIASQGWSWMLENRMPRILDRTQPIASAIAIITKDTSIITREARQIGFPTPMTSTAEQAYFSSISNGWGADDDGTLIRLYAQGSNSSTPSNAEDYDRKLQMVLKLLEGIHMCSAIESLALAHRVGLDLGQVLDLCLDAAGGSAMLSKLGLEIIEVLRGEASSGNSQAPSLQEMQNNLLQVNNEAQLARVPLRLGSEAVNMFNMALQSANSNNSQLTLPVLVRVWTGSL